MSKPAASHAPGKGQLRPYADDSASIGIGDLTVENGRDQVSLHGSLELTRDQAGLELARALKALLDQMVQALEAEKDLPAKLPPPDKPGTVANPFG